jgi:hypothetical protein
LAIKFDFFSFISKIEIDGAVSQYLMQVSMPFLTDLRCSKKYSEINAQSQVCAGENGQNKDTCQVIIELLNSFLLFYFMLILKRVIVVAHLLFKVK